MRPALCLLLIGLLAGCVTPDTLDGTPDGVWVQVPAVNVGRPAAVAQEHCARFGKTAVLNSKITGIRGDWRDAPNRSNFTPIFYYDCKPG